MSRGMPDPTGANRVLSGCHDSERDRACDTAIASLPASSNRSIGGSFARLWNGSMAIPTTKRSRAGRSEEHTSELQSRGHLVCRLLLEKKKDRLARSSRRYQRV